MTFFQLWQSCGVGLRRLSAPALFVASALSATAIGVDTLVNDNGWPRRQILRQEVEQVADEILALNQGIARLKGEIAAQEQRPDVQEVLVRELLGYVRPQDIVLKMRP